MSDFFAVITERFDPDRHIPTTGLTLRPSTWASDDQGGPVEAEVIVEGSAETIVDVFEWLGCGVTIINEDGLHVWTGKIDGLFLTYGPWQYDVTLADVANRVRVSYTTLTAGGEVTSVTTDWSDDDFSQSVYGVRERTANISGHADAAAAASYLVRLLANVSLPDAKRGAGDGTYQAALQCVGLIRELEDRYHTDETGRTEYDPGGGTVAHSLGWETMDTSAGFSDNGEGDTGAYSSFDGLLPPGDAGQPFNVASSLSNNGDYVIVSRPADEAQTLDTTSDGAGFRWDGSSSSMYLVEPKTEGLGFLGVGQQFDIDITTECIPSTHDNPFVVSRPAGVGPNWAIEGKLIVRGTGSERVLCDRDWRSANDTQRDQGGVHDHPKEADGWLHGTLTAAPYVTVSPKPAADELQQDSTTTDWEGNLVGETDFVVKTLGWRVDQLINIPVGGGGLLWKVGISLKRVGTPVDTVRVSVWEDSGGSFGSMIDEGWIATSAVGVKEEMVWCEMDNAGTNTVTDSTSVHIVVERTGTHDPDNYWVLGLIEDADDLYDETVRLYDGSSWVSRPTPASMPFRLWAGLDVTALIKSIIEEYRVRIDGVDVADASGVLINQYEEEGRKALTVVRSLLGYGCADGAGLVLEIVEPRRALIRKRPTADDRRQIKIGEERRPSLIAGGELSPGQLFVGEWADEVGTPLQPSALMPLSPVYLAKMSYTANSDAYDYSGPGKDDPLDLGLINA